MNFTLKKLIYPVLVPNGLLCLVAGALLSREDLSSEVLSYLSIFPYLVVVVGLLLGWRFNRTRLLYALLLLVVAAAGLYGEGSAETDWVLFQSCALLLPWNLLLILGFRERGMLNMRTLLWLLLLAGEVAVVAALWKLQPLEMSYYLDYRLVEIPVSEKLPLSQPALLSNLLVLLLFGWRALRTVSAFEISFFWAHCIILAGLLGNGGQPLPLYLASAGLMLVLGMVEVSHSLAYRDELTGLPGRRALNEELAKLGSRYALAMLDIDHFKKFNDTHGHDVGDQVLRMVASKLSVVGGGGKVFRYGGEEFSVIFPRRSLKDALPFLELLRVAVEEASFIPRGKDRPNKKPKKKLVGKKTQPALKVTISIGGAERSEKLTTSDLVIDAADKALYRAKKGGRNRVCS